MFLMLNLRGRVQALEQKLGQPQPAQVGTISPEPSPAGTIPPPVRIVPSPSGPTSSGKFIAWLKEDWILKLGALLFLIGFGWLASYAFLNNWIGPAGRIALGIIAGALFIVLGWWRIRAYIHQGGIFLVLGSTIVLLTVFAAREIYDFFTPLSALIVMFLSTAFVALASVKYNNRALALSSIILAGIAPLLTNSPATDYIGLFWYLLIVVLGAIWIVVLTGQRELTAAALILVSFYSVPHVFFGTSADKGVLLLFAYAFAAIFFLANTSGILRLKDKEIVPDLVAAAGNGLFLLVWIMTSASDEWKSLIIAAWMIVFVFGAFLIFKATGRRESFYIYAGIGIAMLAAATSAELRGATLTIAYALESGIIAFLAYAILRDARIAQRVSLLLIGPIILSFGSIISNSWRDSIFHKDFVVLFLMSLTLFALGVLFRKASEESQNRETKQLNGLLLIAGSVYAFTLLWLSLHALTKDDDVAVMISLAVYTIVALITYFQGRFSEKRGMVFYGGTLLFLVIARLLFVEVWRMALTGRITTFFLIGALLMSTAFLGRKKKIEPDIRV